MTSPFTARQAGLASLVAAGLIVVSQVSQLVLPLTMPESFWIATQSLRMGLALLAMFALLLALTGLYATQVPEAGALGLVGYLVAFLGTMLVAGNVALTFAISWAIWWGMASTSTGHRNVRRLGPECHRALRPKHHGTHSLGRPGRRRAAPAVGRLFDRPGFRAGGCSSPWCCRWR